MTRILILDEDETVRSAATSALRDRGYTVEGLARSGEALRRLEQDDFDLVLCDLKSTDPHEQDGIVARLTRRDTATEMIVLTTQDGVRKAATLSRKGAYDVLTKPLDPDALLRSVHHALERKRLRKQVQHLSSVIKRRYQIEGIVYRSQQMEEILRLVRRVSQVDATVLILGESGTGKELIARAIHAQSPRQTGPFHAIDCGAIPQSLLESELFGHTKGAFTGAESSRKGLFEVSSGGTVLLDEVGEMPLALQAKLLRVLQEREIRPVGSDRPRKVDVRILAATNRNLQEEANRGTFREDLYYRLNVISMPVPALRDRPDDILPLAEHFLQKYGRKVSRAPLQLEASTASLLLRYRWPGNVRELENAMQLAVALASGSSMRPGDLPESIREGMLLTPFPLDADLTLEEMERRYILHVLKKNGGNRARTAGVLGIGRNTLWRKLKTYGYQG